MTEDIERTAIAGHVCASAHLTVAGDNYGTLTLVYIPGQTPLGTVTAYIHNGALVVDVDADAGENVVITLNDGDVWRDEVPE